MDIEAVTPSRDLAGDFLFRSGDNFIRARVQRTTSDNAILAAVQRGVELVHFKFQCSLANDASGDVTEDATGNHLIFAAEVHGISLESLAGGQSLEGWIAETLEEVVAKAFRKAFFVRQIGARYRLPEAP